MHTHTDTSIYLCNSEYCAVYILRIFRKHTLLYILEDRKSAPMSACFERTRSVYCCSHCGSSSLSLAAKTIPNKYRRSTVASVDPRKQNLACSPSMPTPQTLPWRKSLGSSLICHNNMFCCCLVPKSCPTLCDPMDFRRALSISQSWLKFMSSELGMLPNHLIFCQPFSFCLHSFPASGSFPMSQLFVSRGQRMGASALVLPMNNQGWFPLGVTGLLPLLSTGLSRVFSSTTFQKHQFFSSQPSLWSNSPMHTWLLEKPSLSFYGPLSAKGCLFLLCCRGLPWCQLRLFQSQNQSSDCPSPPPPLGSLYPAAVPISAVELEYKTSWKEKKKSRLCVILQEGDTVGLTQSHWSATHW